MRVTATAEEAAAGRVHVTNRQHFRDLDWLRAHWELSEDGSIVASGALRLPDIGPGQTALVELEGWRPREPGPGERWLSCRVETAALEPWAPAGTEIGWDQIALDDAVQPAAAVPHPGGRIELDSDGYLVHPSLATGPRLSLWRAPTDNDRIAGHGQRWIDQGLPAPLAGQPEVEHAEGHVTVGRDVRVGQATVRHVQVLTALEDGGIHVAEDVLIPPELDDLPRVGTVFELAAGLEALEWFGGGPHESYPDRKRGAQVGRWYSTVTDQFVPYVRPQEAGGRADVRWLEVRDRTGAGVRLTMDRPRQVSITHHRAEDLASTMHAVDLQPRPDAIVHIDAAHRGLGTASCGPDTIAPYLLGPGEYRWAWSLRPLRGAGRE